MGDLHDLALSTLAVRAGRDSPAAHGPLNRPAVFASNYHAGGPAEYTRTGGNPTWAAFEEALGVLEGGRAVSFASGMAAVAAVLDELPVGATVVAPIVAYHGVRALLAEWERAGRVRVRWVDVSDTEATRAAARGADVLWVETPTNPLLGVADLEALCAPGRERARAVVVDSTLATPLAQRPLDLGADVVVHSVTKFLGGHSDLLMGAAVARDDERARALAHRRAVTGATPGVMEAFLALRGLRTLPVRLERGQASALELARRLSEHPEVSRVRYPGLPGDASHERARRLMRGPGAMLALEVTGGARRADALCAAVEVFTYATSLGGVESLIERRTRWAGENGVPQALLRASIGCEDVEDLWADLHRALAATAGARAVG